MTISTGDMTLPGDSFNMRQSGRSRPENHTVDVINQRENQREDEEYLDRLGVERPDETEQPQTPDITNTYSSVNLDSTLLNTYRDAHFVDTNEGLLVTKSMTDDIQQSLNNAIDLISDQDIKILDMTGTIQFMETRIMELERKIELLVDKSNANYSNAINDGMIY